MSVSVPISGRGKPWEGDLPISQHAIAQAEARHGIRPDFVDAAEALRCIASGQGATLLDGRLNEAHPRGARQLWLVTLCGAVVRVVVAMQPAPIIVTVLPHGGATSRAMAEIRRRKKRAGRSADASREFRRVRERGFETDLEDL